MNTNQIKFFSGRYQAVTIAKTYTAQTTLNNFISNAVLGEIAFVKKSDNSVYDGTVAIAAGTEVYLIKKLNNGSYKSYPSFIYKPTVATSIARYATATVSIGSAGVVPVKRVVVSFGGTSDCGNSINGFADPLQTYQLAVIYSSYHGVMDSIEYTYVPKQGDTMADVVTGLIAKMNSTISFENMGKQLRATAGAVTTVAVSGTTPGTLTFDITGATFQNFTLGTIGFCKVVQTNILFGSSPINGYADVLQYESEGMVVDGVKTKQSLLPPLVDITPVNFLVDDYPETTLFTAFQLERVNSETAAVAGEGIKSKTYFETVYTPNGSTVATKLTLLLGL